MNKKQLILAISIFVVLLVISLLTLQKEDSNWDTGTLADKKPLIKDFDVNEVAKFAITDGKETATMAIKDNQWVVEERNSYPASFPLIQNFLLKIQELKIAQNIRLKKSGLKKLKLISPKTGEEIPSSGVQLTFLNKDNLDITSLTLGEPHISKKENPNPFAPPAKDGRYILVKNSSPVLITDPLSEVKPNPALWLNKNFLNKLNLKSLTMLNKSNKQQWCINKEQANAPYTLINLKKTAQPNPKKMQEITSAFSNISFIDVLPGNTEKSTIGLDKPATLILKTMDNITYKIQLGLKNKKAFAKLEISTPSITKRVPGKNEKPELKEKLDKAFEAHQKSVNAQVSKEKFLTNWIYELPLDQVKKVLVKQQDLTVEKTQLPMMLGQ